MSDAAFIKLEESRFGNGGPEDGRTVNESTGLISQGDTGKTAHTVAPSLKYAEMKYI
jgi:hypothetical protein